MSAPQFIASEIYRHSSYGRKHPLAIPRVSSCLDLCRSLGWLPDAVYHDSPRATPAELARFHDPAYIAAVQAAERTQQVSDAVKMRHHLGARGNPVFPEIFRRPATACGGSLHAASLLLAGVRCVYSPAGGTHHGRPDRASGFCYFNDPVLALQALLDGGLTQIVYLDIDAHHGDGVQDAFAEDDRVLTVSVHEVGRWPMTRNSRDPAASGGPADRAGGMARNIPVPAGFNDSEMAYVCEAGLIPLVEWFEPEAVVVQGGSDAVAEDPLSGLMLSNTALWSVVAAVKRLAPRLLCLGGGGYNPWSVARCWTGMWAVLNDLEVPRRLPPESERLLRGLEWRHSWVRRADAGWFTTLADAPRHGPVREDVRAAVRAAMAP
ncbi:acetoin utilization protein AcuC [Limimonas halophila]|uniref:Acetoin utilization protein AcuC n=1 Tax=Limimonas halophila TaxID=1082479 RepID=A0A1G7NSN7_9PROT|nr:acetoin utilization protein AcuC [Limimonas halophila]SDF76947.1 acetoin utilization protein AcuC [Limimonas halophila]